MNHRTWSWRLFRLGGMPRRWHRELDGEQPILADEGVPGRFIARDVRGPGRIWKHRREGFSGWLAVTRARFVAYSYGRRQIHIALDDPRMADLHVDLPDEDWLALSFESGTFRDDWSGVFELRYCTPEARRMREALLNAGARPGSAGR
jgi:hypothetical protein